MTLRGGRATAAAVEGANMGSRDDRRARKAREGAGDGASASPPRKFWVLVRAGEPMTTLEPGGSVLGWSSIDHLQEFLRRLDEVQGTPLGQVLASHLVGSMPALWAWEDIQAAAGRLGARPGLAENPHIPG